MIMHIPDGFLSPQSSLVLYGISIPFIYKASKNVQKKLEGKFVPRIALLSAFSFVIMMFNIPLPGGTTGHATGASVAGIILGPWGGMLAMTVALTIQALLFGDGGVLALGANIWNMAIVMPVISWFIYNRSKHFIRSKRGRLFLSAVVGYISINMAALLTAVELGIQPMMFHTESGQPLYFPFDVWISIPAMMIGHLLVVGFAEAIITAGMVYWMSMETPDVNEQTDNIRRITFLHRYLLFITALLLCTPLGLLAPGTAWGEWSREELERMGLGIIPAGFDTWSSVWSAPFSDYHVGGLPEWIGYVLSGGVGVGLIYISLVVIRWAVKRIYLEKSS